MSRHFHDRAESPLTLSVLATTSTFSVDEACLLYSFQVINVNGIGSVVVTLRHGGSGSSNRAIWGLVQQATAGSSQQVVFNPPIYCELGFGFDFTGSGAGTYAANAQYLPLASHPTFRRPRISDPKRALSGNLSSGPVFPGPPEPGGPGVGTKGGGEAGMTGGGGTSSGPFVT